ncbi:Coiled-coil domain-containing protein 96 [Allomyces arbusculus]|nr:Coiled-coil domain-containing protein 96 [Allomyces arbusculus]
MADAPADTPAADVPQHNPTGPVLASDPEAPPSSAPGPPTDATSTATDSVPPPGAVPGGAEAAAVTTESAPAPPPGDGPNGAAAVPAPEPGSEAAAAPIDTGGTDVAAASVPADPVPADPAGGSADAAPADAALVDALPATEAALASNAVESPGDSATAEAVDGSAALGDSTVTDPTAVLDTAPATSTDGAEPTGLIVPANDTGTGGPTPAALDTPLEADTVVSESVAVNAAPADPSATAPATASDTSANTAAAAPASRTSRTASAAHPAIDRAACLQRIKDALAAREGLRATNVQLQNKLSDVFRKRRAEDKGLEADKSVADQGQRYATLMAQLRQLRGEYDDMERTNSQTEHEYKIKLEEKKREIADKSDEFRKYKRQIAQSAENSRTGKPIPVKVIDQLEALEIKREQDVAAVRLENIKLRNKLKRHEHTLRQKEELAEGLHLIDFEQLKIENQTYNEKIEERNEELMKLRKKITNVVQVLAHIKEKLQFVQEENLVLKSELQELEGQVTIERDRLPVAKQQREALRAKNVYLREKNGLLGNEALLRDFEERVDAVAALEQEIHRYQKLYSTLSIAQARLKTQERNRTLLPMILGPTAAARGAGPTFKLPARHAAVLAAKASATASTHASFRGGKSLRVAPAATARPPSAQTATAMARTAPASRHQHALSPLQPRRVPSAGLSRSRAVPGGSASSSSLPLPRADRSDASLVDALRAPVTAAVTGSQPLAPSPAQRYLKKRAPAGKVQGAGWTSMSTNAAPRAGTKPAAALARCASSPDLGTSPPSAPAPALTAARDSGVQLSTESVSTDMTKNVVPAPWAAALTLSALPTLPGTAPAPAPRMHLARPLLYLHHLQLMWGVDDDAVELDADLAVERATRANAFTLRFKVGDDDVDVERRATRRAARKEHFAGAWTVRFHDAVACVLFDPDEQVRGVFGTGGGRNASAVVEDVPCAVIEDVQDVPLPPPQPADAVCHETDESTMPVADDAPVPDACICRAEADLSPADPEVDDEPIPTVVAGTCAQNPPAPTADTRAAVLAAPQAGELDWVLLDGDAETAAAAAAVEPMNEDTVSEVPPAKPVAKGPVRRLLCRLVASMGIDVCAPSNSAAAAVTDGTERTTRVMP